MTTLVATEPEIVTFNTLVRIGLTPGVDFEFQSKMLGGRLDKGGLILDFLIFDPPNLAINVNGEFFHYSNQFVFEASARDVIAREQLAKLGINLIFIDEKDVLRNPFFYVREALRGRDHSVLGSLGAF